MFAVHGVMGHEVINSLYQTTAPHRTPSARVADDFVGACEEAVDQIKPGEI
jgi:hypothetical protein